MKAALLTLILSVVFTTAFAATAFSAQAKIRHPFIKNGFVEANVYYDWDARLITFDYTTKGYTEVLEFNAQRGYQTTTDTVNAANKPFLDQWVFKFGTTCQCETGPVDYAMPIFFTGAPAPDGNFLPPGATQNIEGRQCTLHQATANSPNNLAELWLAPDGTPCKVLFEDKREITFSNVVVGTPRTVPVPDNCRCGKPMDISLVLDRSGSISKTEFKDQKGFVQNFSEMFQYGPLNAALSIVHFNTPAWTTLTQTEGTNPDNVVSGVNDLKCCFENNPKETSCCCCGTSISSGIRMGADNLKSGRANVQKILIVVSDGYHNHDINGKDCSGSTRCRDDLAAAVTYARNLLGQDLTIFSLGVGADRDISMDEMKIIAEQHEERIIRRDDFAALASDFLELVARSCQENINPCGGCCGFCVCGQCVPPDGCDSTNFCAVNEVSDVCCKSTPRDCVLDPNDKCKTWTCDSNLNECVSADVPCKADTSCFTYRCEPQTGECKSTLLCPDSPECVSNTECDDQNDCTEDLCVDQFCQWTPITCAGADDKCQSIVCEPKGGCMAQPLNVTEMCDDFNVCTNDRCDPVQGCVHEAITCQDADLCTDDVCDPNLGCLYTPMICPAPDSKKNKDSCFVTFCEEGQCKKRKVDCGVDPIVAPAVISTVAIVGIVIGAVLLVACAAGGGAYAYTQAAGGSGVAPVANNPIYVGSGSQGTNPLYQVS